MNFRTTVILLVLLVGALAFYIVANRSADPEGTPKPKQTSDERGRKLLDMNADEVTKLAIRPGEGAPAGVKPFEMNKVNGKWNIAQPIDWPADSVEGGNLVDQIVSLRSTGSIDINSSNGPSTGLSRPRFRVELTDGKGKVSKLAIGERSILGPLYVSLDSDPKTGFLVNSGPLADKFAKGTAKLVAPLRDKQLIRVSALEVTQMQIERGNQKISLAKVGNVWQITSPVQLQADASEVSELISSVTNLRAEEFSDEPSAASAGAGFDKPRAIITLSTGTPASTQPPTQPTTQPMTGPATKPSVSSQSVTVVVGQAVDIEGEKSWLKVSTPGTVSKISLPAASFEKISQASPLSLRDRRVVTIDGEQVSEISLTTEKPSTTQPNEPKTVTFSRRKDNFQFGPEMPKPASGPTGTTLPVSIEPPMTRPATTQPATSPVKPSTTTQSSRANVSLSASLFGLLQAEGEAKPATAPVPATATSTSTVPATSPVPASAPSPATQPALTALAATQPASTQPSTTTSPTTSPGMSTQPATAPAIALPPIPKAPPSKWIVGLTGDTEADDDGVSDLLADLNPLRAAKYLDKMPATTQPTPTVYILRVKAVAAAGAASSYELRITDPGGEAKLIGQYKDLIFELDRAILAKLQRDMTKKQAATTPPPMPRGMPGGGFPGGLPGGFGE